MKLRKRTRKTFRTVRGIDRQLIVSYLTALWLATLDAVEGAARSARRHGTAWYFDRRTRRERGQTTVTSAILTVTAAGIVILVGILIYGEISDALPSPSQSELQNASQNATKTFADTMELAPVVLLVFVASLVIGVVNRFRK